MRVGTKQADVSEGLEQSLAQSKCPKYNENKSCYLILRILGVGGKSISILKRRNQAQKWNKGFLHGPALRKCQAMWTLHGFFFISHLCPSPPHTHSPLTVSPGSVSKHFPVPGTLSPLYHLTCLNLSLPPEAGWCLSPASVSIRGLAMYIPL